MDLLHRKRITPWEFEAYSKFERIFSTAKVLPLRFYFSCFTTHLTTHPTYFSNTFQRKSQLPA